MCLSHCDQSKLPNSPLLALIHCYEQVFPNISTLLKTVATLQVIIYEAERSFAVLRHLKKFLPIRTGGTV